VQHAILLKNHVFELETRPARPAAPPFNLTQSWWYGRSDWNKIYWL